ncbi:MAG: hypothetical protein HQ510_03045 [Candidatus Marinimicrobia bacterium]|nr:hypothetical protein [Candidatus Neomarinimicrobiota bacterium]
MYRTLAIDFVEWFLAFAGFCNLLLGLILILKPKLIIDLNQKMSIWISTRSATKQLEIQRDTEKFLFKYNSILGWILLMGFVISLYVYFTQFQLNVFRESVDQFKYGPMVDIVMTSAKWIFIIFVLLGIFSMLLLIFTPKTLKRIIGFTDKWISTRLIFLPLEKMYFQFDGFVINHNVIFGVLLVIFSGYMFYLFR